MIVILLIVVCSVPFAQAQELDSLVNQRENVYRDYARYRESMKERTWVNLIELGKKASSVIERDNHLIEVLTESEKLQLEELEQINHQLQIETDYLSDQLEKNARKITRYQRMNAILLVVLFGLVLFCIALVTLYIIRTNQLKHSQVELERFWSMKDEYSMAHKEKESELLRQIRLLEIEQKAMQKEFVLLSDQRTDARQKLEKEILSRRKVEEEIKELLDQLRTK